MRKLPSAYFCTCYRHPAGEGGVRWHRHSSIAGDWCESTRPQGRAAAISYCAWRSDPDWSGRMLLAGHPEPFKDAITRLQAYAVAGAECLYAPALRTREEIPIMVA